MELKIHVVWAADSIPDDNTFNKVDKKAVIRNRYNRIPHPAPNTKWEMDTYNWDGAKIKTTQMKNQMDSSFPADCHNAFLNKMNNKSKTSRKRTNIDN